MHILALFAIFWGLEAIRRALRTGRVRRTRKGRHA
jgi:hypothetical protein